MSLFACMPALAWPDCSVIGTYACFAMVLGFAVQVGMTSINDFATTYMCQSLPFGGVKDSGFGRFAGVEGLRALCVTKAVCQDRLVHHLLDQAH